MARPSVFKKGLSQQISQMTGLVHKPCEKRQDFLKKKKKKQNKKKKIHDISVVKGKGLIDRIILH